MTFEYIINIDLVGRTAANLIFAINNCKTAVHFCTDGRRVNAKSLVGILSANIKQSQHTTVEIENPLEADKIKGICNTIGQEAI